MATPQTAPGEAPDTFDPVPFSRDEPGTIFLLTSLTSGSSAIITATSRLEHILKSNKVVFKAVDLATDDKARRLWQWKGKGRRLPGVAKDGEVLGNFEEIEDWNEHGELRQMLGVSKKKKKSAGKMDGTTVPPNPSRTATPNIVQDREPVPSGPAGRVPTAFQQASVASTAAAAGKRKAAGIKSAVNKVEAKRAATNAQSVAKTEIPAMDGASDKPTVKTKSTEKEKIATEDSKTKDTAKVESNPTAEEEKAVTDTPKTESKPVAEKPAEEKKDKATIRPTPKPDVKPSTEKTPEKKKTATAITSSPEKTPEKKKTATAITSSPEKKRTPVASTSSHEKKRTPASTVGSPEKKKASTPKEASATDKSKTTTRPPSRPSTTTRSSSKPPTSTSSRSSSRLPTAKDTAADKTKGTARSSSRPATATRSSSRPPTATTSGRPSTAKGTPATDKAKATATKSPNKSDAPAKSMSSRPATAKSSTNTSSRPSTAKPPKPSSDKAAPTEKREKAVVAATPSGPSAKGTESVTDAAVSEDKVSALKTSVEKLRLQDEKEELVPWDDETKTPTHTPVAE